MAAAEPGAGHQTLGDSFPVSLVTCRWEFLVHFVMIEQSDAKLFQLVAASLQLGRLAVFLKAGKKIAAMMPTIASNTSTSINVTPRLVLRPDIKTSAKKFAFRSGCR